MVTYTKRNQKYRIGRQTAQSPMHAPVIQEPICTHDNVAIDVVLPEQLYAIYENHASPKELISGIYFECLRVSHPDDTDWILIANSRYGATLPIDRDTVIDQRKELNVLLFDGLDDIAPVLPGNSNPDRFTLLLNIVTRANMLKLNTTATSDVLQAYFDNTQAAYTRYVSEFLKQLPPLTSISSTIESPGYSLLKHFSLLYAIEINELLDIYSRKPNGYLTVVDEATCTGFFITTCVSVLPRHVLDRTRFLGVDLKLTDMVYGMEAVSRYSVDVAWQLADINAPDHTARLRSFNNGHPIDLLVLNHVLEHLDAHAPDEYIMALLKAAQTLIISVPFESDYRTSISSHIRQFDQDSLLALGKSIEEASSRQVTCDIRFIGCGLLIFHRETQENESIIEVTRHAC
ncbi:MAG: hypothetical protein JXB07_11310 [Anaerolineae bacterium]|nr:hypothetical protein [Anaerolineae bacterium]